MRSPPRYCPRSKHDQPHRRASGPLRGTIAVPGDKSITHRALILGALAEGDTRVRGWVPAEVCLATLRCIRALGVDS